MSSARATAFSLRAPPLRASPPARRTRRSVRSPWTSTSSHVRRITRWPASSRSASLRGIPLAIAARAVELEAVELDGEPFGGPVRVHFVRGWLSFDCSIEGWGRYLGARFEEGLEAPFEDALLGARL